MFKIISLALATALFAAGAAHAQSCLPTPIEQSADRYVVDFGGIRFTIPYSRLRETGNNARAEELRVILQSRADFIQPLYLLRNVSDPDGWNDPATNRTFHSDAFGRPVEPGRATHITSRCTIVSVEWNSVEGLFVVTWSGNP